MGCGLSKKIFRQGFCYDCFQSSPAAGDWIMKPELSTAHLDIEDRDLAYEKKAQLQPHIVYFAVASHVKVGVTRKTQVPTRWIDQGATAAFPIVEVPNRYLAGITEIALKNHYSDKTSWMKMLKNENEAFDKDLLIKEVYPLLPEEIKSYFEATQHELYQMEYPLTISLEKISSLNLEKTPLFQGKLIGIKGQYLVFEDGTVLNVRTYAGYRVQMSF